MEDNKELEKNGEEIKNVDNNVDELNRELEEIAQTFRDELKKSYEEAEKTEAETEEPEATKDDALYSEEPCEPELCKCCGECEAEAEYGEYCGECYKAMCKYPFNFSSIIAVVVVIAMAVISVISFFDFSEGYAKAIEAKNLKKDKKLASSILAYDEAIKYFENNNVKAKELYLESAEVVAKTMDNGTESMDDIVDRIGKALEKSNSKLPVYKNDIELREEVLSLYGTMQSFYSIMQKEEYADFTTGDKDVYNKIITEIEAMAGTSVTITDVDGESTKEIPVDESMVKFCCYMLAYTMDNMDDAVKYLKEAYELNPDYLWLHGYEIAADRIRNGDFEGGEAIAEKMLDVNVEEPDGYSLYSFAARMSGDTEGAVKWAEKGVENCPGNAEILRYQAIAYIVAGDFEAAKKCTDEAMRYQEYVLLYYTAIIAENELGNTQTVNDLVSAIESQGIQISSEMLNYLNGTVTATEIFTKGSGDVE